MRTKYVTSCITINLKKNESNSFPVFRRGRGKNFFSYIHATEFFFFFCFRVQRIKLRSKETVYNDYNFRFFDNTKKKKHFLPFSFYVFLNDHIAFKKIKICRRLKTVKRMKHPPLSLLDPTTKKRKSYHHHYYLFNFYFALTSSFCFYHREKK